MKDKIGKESFKVVLYHTKNYIDKKPAKRPYSIAHSETNV